MCLDKIIPNGLVMVLFMMLAASCTKDTSNENLGNNVLVTDQSVTVLYNGDTLKVNDGNDGFYNVVGSGGGQISADGDFLWREFTEYANANGDTLRFYFIETFTSEPSDALKERVVSVGTYPFGVGTDNSIAEGEAVDGAAVVFITGGKKWSSEYGAQGSDNFFVVDSHVVNANNTSKYVTYGRFSCTLFDTDMATINFTEGYFSGRTIAK